MLLSAFVGCTDTNADGEQSDSETETQKPVEPLTIISEGESEYIILRSSKATAEEVAAVLKLRSAIEEKYGKKLRVMNELDAEEDQKAICIGKVPRQSVTDKIEDVGYNEYVIGVSGTDVVICGGHAAKTVEAIDRFIAEVLTEEGTTLAVAGDLFIMLENPNERTVLVNGTDLMEYSIVTSSDAVKALSLEAKALSEYCISEFGFGLATKTDVKEADGKEIIIGSSNRQMSIELQTALAECGEDKGLIFFEEDRIYLTGNSTAAVRDAIVTFKKEYLNRSLATSDTLNLSTANKTVPVVGEEYTVMSFNLMYNNPYQDLAPALVQIRESNPDILGVQECTTHFYDVLCKALGNEYGVVGEINDTSWQNWRNAIFYRKDRFELVETKTQWLSTTPSIMSKLGVSEQYRILTYAVLKDKETGKTLVHCNTHMGFGAEERPMQYNILVKLLSKLDYPMLITGDFNVDPSYEYYKQMNSAGYQSAHEMTSNNDNVPTLNTSMIDFCFVTPDTINVTSHRVLEELVDGKDTSDHEPVVVKFRLR